MIPRASNPLFPLAAVPALLAALCLLVVPAAAQQADSAPPSAVPVTTARATRQDVSIYLRGLGTTQAFQSVQVRARVDGTLMQVAVKEGQDVNQGDLIAVIDPRPFRAALDAATAKKQQDDAQLANAQADLVRYAALAKQSFASRQQVDTQQAMVKQLVAQIAGDVAAVETAQLNLSYAFITAPVQGRIGLRQLDPGNMVHATDVVPIISIAQIRPISVVFTVPQDDLPRIATAMETGTLAVTAFGSDGKTELDQGTLLTPDNTIDSGTGTIKLKATFPNPHNRLWPGQFVNARLQLGTDRNALVVPARAVQNGPENLYVYVVQPDSTVVRKPVEVAREVDGLAVIAKGLDDGQVVVTEGQSRLQAGMRVAPAEAGTSQGVSHTAPQANTQASPPAAPRT
jgi:multidrug efflux system membrane fusion protein